VPGARRRRGSGETEAGGREVTGKLGAAGRKGIGIDAGGSGRVRWVGRLRVRKKRGNRQKYFLTSRKWLPLPFWSSGIAIFFYLL
jgi:hypothetical protein